MYLNLAIFLLVTAFIIAVVKPKSKIQVCLISIITPILFAFFFGTFMATGLEVPRHSLSPYLGGFIGRNGISILISILTLFFCLKQKLDKKEEYKFPKGIFFAIFISAIIGCLQLYTSHLSNKVTEQYLELISKEVSNTKERGIEDNPVTKKNHEEMVGLASRCNEELPEDIGLGMIMQKCEIENMKMVFTIQWEGMTLSDFTDEVMAEFRESIIEGLKEEQKSPIMKAMINQMKDYGYDFVYRFVNENEEELYSMYISPFEI